MESAHKQKNQKNGNNGNISRATKSYRNKAALRDMDMQELGIKTAKRQKNGPRNTLSQNSQSFVEERAETILADDEYNNAIVSDFIHTASGKSSF
jgi:hypothetical protein